MHAVTGFLTDKELALGEQRHIELSQMRADPGSRPRCKECGSKLNYLNKSGYCGAHRNLRPVNEEPYTQCAAGPGRRGRKVEMELLCCVQCNSGFERAASAVRVARKKGRTEFCCSQSCSGARNAGKPRRRAST